MARMAPFKSGHYSKSHQNHYFIAYFSDSWFLICFASKEGFAGSATVSLCVCVCVRMCLSAYYFHAPLVCIRLTRILLKLTAISIATAVGSRQSSHSSASVRLVEYKNIWLRIEFVWAKRTRWHWAHNDDVGLPDSMVLWISLSDTMLNSARTERWMEFPLCSNGSRCPDDRESNLLKMWFLPMPDKRAKIKSFKLLWKHWRFSGKFLAEGIYSDILDAQSLFLPVGIWGESLRNSERKPFNVFLRHIRARK